MTEHAVTDQAVTETASSSHQSSKAARTDEFQGAIVHIYGDIEEADNQLPRWWLWTFFGSVLFGIGYWFFYHGWSVGALPPEEYVAALEAAAGAGGEVSEELLVGLSQDRDAVAAGKEIFIANCSVCHLDSGAGKIGPNLTDAYWIHGNSIKEIHETINAGVLAKGMPAWGPTLGPKAVQRVTAFTLTLRNKNIPGKEPQGELQSQ